MRALIATLKWLPLASFLALALTVLVSSVAPDEHHFVYAVVEWTEMLLGGASALLGAVLFLSLHFADAGFAPSKRDRWLSVLALGIWVLFWLVALLTRGTD